MLFLMGVNRSWIWYLHIQYTERVVVYGRSKDKILHPAKPSQHLVHATANHNIVCYIHGQHPSGWHIILACRRNNYYLQFDYIILSFLNYKEGRINAKTEKHSKGFAPTWVYACKEEEHLCERIPALEREW